MSRVFCLLLVFSAASISFGQDKTPGALQYDDLRWEKWEIPTTAREKIKEIDKLRKIRALHPVFKNDYWNPADFHVVDYNIDGIPDFIYIGFTGGDCNHTLFLEGNKKSYTIAYDYYGEIIDLWNYKEGEALCFRLLERPGCDGSTSQVEAYEPQYEDGRLVYQLISKEAYIEWSFFPDKFDLHVPFRVRNNYYRLRSGPAVDNTPNFNYYDLFCADGNIIAEYLAGSTGTALASFTDNAGIEWWFVLMDNNRMPQNSIFHPGRNNGSPAKYYGWMSSAYLEAEK